MKNKLSSLGFIILSICCACNQKETKKEPYSNRSIDQRLSPLHFNPDNVKTYTGQVVEIFTVSTPGSYSEAVGLMLRTDKGDIPVHLGPSRFVLDGPINLAMNQAIEVKGSEQYIDGSIFITAQEVKLDGSVLKLRDEDGYPLWSGWRRD